MNQNCVAFFSNTGIQPKWTDKIVDLLEASASDDIFTPKASVKKEVQYYAFTSDVVGRVSTTCGRGGVPRQLSAGRNS